MTDIEMESLLRNIAQMSAVVYGKEPHWQTKAMELPGPGATRAIAQLARKLGSKLPGSYNQFLHLHDGCLNFWPAWTLFSTADIQLKDALKTGAPMAVFGGNQEGEILFFHPKYKDKLGENEVIHADANGRIEERYPSFSAFLGTTAYILQTRILDKGYSAALQRQVKKSVH